MAMTAVATIAMNIVFLPVGVLLHSCSFVPWSLLETEPGRSSFDDLTIGSISARFRAFWHTTTFI